MQSTLVNLTWEVEFKEGEVLTLPKEAVKHLTPGRWLVAIMPANGGGPDILTRSHEAFLKSYSDEDEGLYDDYPGR